MRDILVALLTSVLFGACCGHAGAAESPRMIWKQPRATLLILDRQDCGAEELDAACADLAFDCDPYADRQRGEVTMSAPLSRAPKTSSKGVRFRLLARARDSRAAAFSYRGTMDPYANDWIVTAETTVRDPLFEALSREGTLTMIVGAERREVPLEGMADLIPSFLFACGGVSS